ncbi:hypothetical protein K474DRAFT_1712070 [Panus rudis PR-1116 ss-1]|nr:hypothetical protein K474DRAFT_1712070 [Panus rudis PR-1116 ss-1]
MQTTRDMTVRDLLEAPSPTDVAFYGTIYIFHPGDDSLLLSLPAYDSFQGRGGISHRLVREACSILANNNDGFLTADREGNQLVPNDDAILAAGEYYYRCNLADPLYPVVTDFAAWTFPREIPASWTSRSTQERAQRLHLARSRSAMSDTAGIDDVANGVTLRNDAYAFLDANGFVFYPPAPGVDMHPHVSEQFLYARFAYTIINCCHRKASRSSLHSTDSGSDEPEGNIEQPDINHSITGVSLQHVMTSLSKQPMSEEEEFSAFEKEWQESLARRFPWLMELPEVEDPLTSRSLVIGPTASELDMACWSEAGDVNDVEDSARTVKLKNQLTT